MSMGTLALVRSFALLVLAVTGAFSAGTQAPKPAAETPVAPTKDYILRLGDEIEIKLYYHSDLTTSVVIRPDGKISFPLIGEIQAAGVTPAALATEISTKLEREIKNTQTIVTVKKFSELRFYVGGEVVNAGMYQLSQPMTTLQAIMQAGGFKPTAQPKNIMIVRALDNNTPQIIKLDLKESKLEQLDASKNLALQPLDIVFVPKSKIAKANDFVEFYMKRLNPISTFFGLNYNLGAFTFRE